MTKSALSSANETAVQVSVRWIIKIPVLLLATLHITKNHDNQLMAFRAFRFAKCIAKTFKIVSDASGHSDAAI
jgi:hypothetical protein